MAGSASRIQRFNGRSVVDSPKSNKLLVLIVTNDPNDLEIIAILSRTIWVMFTVHIMSPIDVSTTLLNTVEYYHKNHAKYTHPTIISNCSFTQYKFIEQYCFDNINDLVLYNSGFVGHSTNICPANLMNISTDGDILYHSLVLAINDMIDSVSLTIITFVISSDDDDNNISKLYVDNIIDEFPNITVNVIDIATITQDTFDVLIGSETGTHECVLMFASYSDRLNNYVNNMNIHKKLALSKKIFIINELLYDWKPNLYISNSLFMDHFELTHSSHLLKELDIHKPFHYNLQTFIDIIPHISQEISSVYDHALTFKLYGVLYKNNYYWFNTHVRFKFIIPIAFDRPLIDNSYTVTWNSP